MSKKTKIWLTVIAILVAVVAVIIVKSLKNSGKELVVRTYVVGDYTVENTVTATGTIEPVETVEVGTQVSGKVETIYVDFNSVVKKGDLLAELDKLTLNESLSRAQANLTSAESQLKYAKLTYERTKQLYEQNAATLAAYQEAQNSYTQAQMSKKNAQASYDQAKVDLGYASIYSPIDGVVLDRAVEVGQTVAASFSTPTLFTLANDLTRMQVEANVDEADIGQVKVEQMVTFTVDAYPDDVFEGKVNQIRMQPITTSNVVTYTVIIEAPNPEQKLFPGMTASVTIVTESASGLAVPAEAFNFTPSDDVKKALMKESGKSKDKPINDSEGGKHVGPLPQMQDGKTHALLWVKNNGMIKPCPVKTGVSDGAYKMIEIGVQAGDSVVLSAEYVAKETKKASQGKNPFMPGRPGGRKNK